MLNNRFDQRLQSLLIQSSQEISKLLANIDECKGYWEAFRQLSPSYLERMKHSVIVSSSGSSTRIEGSILSDEAVEELLRSAKIRKLASRDEQEVMGYLETIKEVFESHEAMIFSENLIKYLHVKILKWSEKDTRHKGQYKFGSNRIEALDSEGKVVGIIFNPTPPHLTAKEMLELLEWTIEQLKKKNYHPLLINSNFIF